MDEAKLALEVTKGIKGLFQDLIAPDVKAITSLAELKCSCPKKDFQFWW